MGAPAPTRGLRRLSWPISDRSLLTRLLRGLPGVDVRIVADPTLRGQAARRTLVTRCRVAEQVFASKARRKAYRCTAQTG